MHARLKVTGCLILILALPIAALAQAGAPDQPEVESQAAGNIQLVRWSVLLNSSGADAVKKIAVPMKSASKGFEGYSASGFELRQCIADALTNQGVEGIDPRMVYAQGGGPNSLFIQNLYINIFNNQNNNNVQMNANAQDSSNSVVRTPQGKMHVVIHEAQINGNLNIANRRSTRITGSQMIEYEGDLTAGDAVAFMLPVMTPAKVEYDLL